jgi:enediyne biosynthesis protein E4
VITAQAHIRFMTVSAVSLVGALLAGGGCSSTTHSEDSASVSITLRPKTTVAPAQGAAYALSIVVRNDAANSKSVPVTLTLTAPDGKQVPFYTTSVFAYSNKESTEDVSTTPAQWFPATGRFIITATSTSIPQKPQLAFDVVAPTVAIPTFADVSQQAGVATSIPPATCGQFANGAAWGDVDGDGDPDLLVTRLGDPVQLFINDGKGHFDERAAQLGLGVRDANGAAFADYDNDGDSDVLIVRDGTDLLFANDGTGHFTDVSAKAGIGDDNARGMNASWGDFDGDGYLDVYVTNYMKCTGDWKTAGEIVSQVSYYDDTLYHNNGDGTFSDATALLEHDPATRDDGSTIGAGYTAAWIDYNGDQRPDLYLANDFVGPAPDNNRLWRNDGPSAQGWKFTEVSLDSGVALFMNTMGIAVADVDRDGDWDMALSNIAGNKLMRNDGKGGFVEDPQSGIERPTQQADISSVTWGNGFYDFNLDGWEDLYMGAGNFQRAPGTPVGVQPNELFMNDGTGATFGDVSSITGAADPDDTKGVAFADYDMDGDIDMFVVDQGGSTHLFQNITPRGSNHWLEVRAAGASSDRDGCGATVQVEGLGPIMQRIVPCGSGSTGSADQPIAHFGLGSNADKITVSVRWPTGRTLTLDDVAVDQILTVQEPGK